jgi:nucleoside 2-deoxyribosyltransferase
MKDFFDILKEFVPLWLTLITLGFGYLIYLYTRIFKQTNELAEKQAQYLKERIDTVDKTTGIFERTVKHQEGDLNRLYEVNEKLKEQLEKDKDFDLKKLDEQLNDISNNLKLIKDSQVNKDELERLKEEIDNTKNSTIIKYDNLIQNLDIKEITKEKVEKLKSVFVIMPFTDRATRNYQVIKNICQEQGLDVYRADETITAGESIGEKIKSLISKSDLIITDVSGNNANVMYELGFAHAINKPVILLASKVEELRIDVSNYKIILFNDSEESMTKLSSSLRESLEEVRKEARRKKLIELRDSLVNQLPLNDYLNLMHKILSWMY